MRVRSSNRPRPGRRFEPVQERELRGDALAAIRALPHAYRGVSIWKEVAGPYGIPDFLVVIGPRDQLLNRAALPVAPLLHEIDAGIVAHASAKVGRTAATFASRLNWSLASIERRIPELTRSGALMKTGEGRFVRPEALRPIGRIYAIETKVKDWRRALKQARTYGLWCDNYVVVMSSLSESSLEGATEAVKGDAGGLFVAGRWVRRPRAKKLSAARRLWGSEHVLGSIAAGRSPALGNGKPLKPSH